MLAVRQPRSRVGLLHPPDIYSRANKELGIAGPRVRAIAGLESDAAPSLVITFAGEAGAGLDALWIELAKQAAVGTEP